MTFCQLDTLITEADNSRIALNNIVAQIEEQLEQLTLVPGAPNQDALLKGFDAFGTFWRLQQTTPNAGSDYLGVYKLPQLSICSVLTRVEIISHTPPALPDAPARVLPCNADPLTGWVSLASVSNLFNQSFNAFEIRSATGFEIKVGITACQPGCDITAVLANVEQVDTGVDFTQGQPYTITASGTWTHDQNNVAFYNANGHTSTSAQSKLPSAKLGRLIGKLGANGAWFSIGVSLSGNSGGTGRLYLAMNDVPGSYYNNAGQVIVEVCLN